jgi:hypothetical protein
VERWPDGKAITEIASDLFALIPQHARKRHTVKESLVERKWIIDIQGAPSLLALCHYVQLWPRVRDVHLSEIPDTFSLEMDSSKSCYDFLFYGAIVSKSWTLN